MYPYIYIITACGARCIEEDAVGGEGVYLCGAGCAGRLVSAGERRRERACDVVVVC